MYLRHDHLFNVIYALIQVKDIVFKLYGSGFDLIKIKNVLDDIKHIITGFKDLPSLIMDFLGIKRMVLYKSCKSDYGIKRRTNIVRHSRDEFLLDKALLCDLVKLRPKIFIPAHGEYRHLVEHSKLAQSLGQPHNHIYILSNGDALYAEGRRVHVIKEYTSGEDVMVDGYGIGDVGASVLRDRKNLSQSGLITIAVALDTDSGSLMAVPEMRTTGFVYAQDNQDLLDEALSIVYNTIGKCTDTGSLDKESLTRAIKSDMKSYIYKKTKRHPVIIPIILYV